jgi:hypothetical protein
MTHHSISCEQQIRAGIDGAMAEIAISPGKGAAVKTAQLLEAGLRHKQIRRHAKSSAPHGARLIKAQDLIEVFPWCGSSGKPGLQNNPSGHQSLR